MSIAMKSNLTSALQAFSLGGGWLRKASRMPQDGRSPDGFVWGEKHKSMLRYVRFFIRRDHKTQTRPTGLLERNRGICSVQPTYCRNHKEFRLFCYMRLNRLGQEQCCTINALDDYIKLSDGPSKPPIGVFLPTICQNYIV